MPATVQLDRRRILKLGACGAAATGLGLAAGPLWAATASPAAHVPGQTLHLGMATEWARWGERVGQTGPVELRRCFQPTGTSPA